MKTEDLFSGWKYEPQEPREFKIEGPKQQRYIAKFDIEKYYPNLKGDLEKLCKKYVEAGRELSKACETAADSYAKVFEVIAKSLPGWAADLERWTYNPNPEEINTREQAFEGIYKRRKKGKVVRR